MAGLVLFIAFLYASVGFGGGSGYLAVMSFFDIAAPIAASTALVLNIAVSGVAFINYTRHGHLRTQLLWPFVIGSIPAAFLGGILPLGQLAYQVLLNSVLLYMGLLLLFVNNKKSEERPVKPPSWPLAFIAGIVLGMLSGMLGIGGGIFLSPLILVAGWGMPKQAAASAAGFILLNSISGLAGRASGGTLIFGSFGGVLVVLGILGGLAGSLLGVRYLSGRAIRRLLGIVLLTAVARFLWAYFG
ncbi:MAG: hypothetical protein A2Z16_04735 [Chloroflexi bacterium RBG_16_54_18]|nr:MAG: hypothetical protein A2Z16_04735 [Chloroflexi bacterium RBG_16_54_18]